MSSAALEFEVWRGYTSPTVRVRLFALEGFSPNDLEQLLILLQAQLKAFDETSADERQGRGVGNAPPIGEEAAPA